MRFENVVGTAFGALAGRSLNLAPEMTVIYGPNEAGKSTLFAALYAGLVGRKASRGRQSGPQREFRRRHKPWTGSAWRVELTVGLDSGRRLHLKQNLGDGTVSLTDAATGERISVKALEKELGTSLETDGFFDGSCLLGLDRDAVRSTLFVGQADVLAVLRNADELQSHLQRAAASAHVDTTVEEALQRIREQRSTRVGSPHVGNRPLRALTAAAKEAGNAADAAMATRHRLLTEKTALARKVTASVQASTTLTELEAVAEWVEIDRLLGRARQARDLEKKLAETSQLGSPADEAAVRQATGIVERYSKRGARPAEPTGVAAAVLQKEIDELPDVPDGAREPEPDVLHLEAELAASLAALETLRAEPVSEPQPIRTDVAADELRSIADRIEEAPPRLRTGIEEQLLIMRDTLAQNRAEHGRRVSEFEAQSAEYSLHQDRYGQQLRDYEDKLNRYKADESDYRAQVKARDAARHRNDAARAAHDRQAADRRNSRATARKRARTIGFSFVGGGGLAGVAALAVGLGGLMAIAVVLGVLGASLVVAGVVSLSRKPPEEAAATFSEAPLPPVRERPAPPSPPPPPSAAPPVHPGAVPEPTSDHLQLSREVDGWKSQRDAHAERTASARARASVLGVGEVPLELRDLARSIDDRAAAEARYWQYQARIDGVALQVRTHAEALLLRLGRVQPESSEEELVAHARRAFREYVDRCKARDEQGKKAERKPDLVAALQQRQQREATHAAALASYDGLGGELVKTAADLGGESGSESDALKALQGWLANQAALADSRAKANLDIGKLEQLLAARSIAEIEEEAETRRLVAPIRPLIVDAGQLAKLDAARQAKAAADGDVRESRRAIRDLVEVAEPIAPAAELEIRTTKALQDVKDLDRYLALAEEHLQIAKERAHADIAPALADTMRPWVPRVTAGRYLDITVDPEDLRLYAFDSRGLKSEADILSHGTAEQLFLLLRIALATHLSTIDESVPLVLDDVTVQADPERTLGILELLHEMCTERQVVLFTQEPEVILWAKENLAPDAVVAL